MASIHKKFDKDKWFIMVCLCWSIFVISLVCAFMLVWNYGTIDVPGRYVRSINIHIWIYAICIPVSALILATIVNMIDNIYINSCNILESVKVNNHSASSKE